ncbi:Lipocalin-like protein [Tenacibaculum sp. 190524A02b]|uniref:Lipocalin-like protein n=1 Tax=Tenacibaculum vairaonense TaxID=3137860 RepID=A0ABP1FBB9_9FLAO
MKKLFFLLISVSIITSCSKDENTQPQKQTENSDSIVGIWTLQKNNGFEVNDCEKKSTYTIKNDNTYTYNQFTVTNRNCTESTKNFQKGEWKNNNNGTYYFKRHGFTSGGDIPIKFENNNETMIIGRFTWIKK